MAPVCISGSVGTPDSSARIWARTSGLRSSASFRRADRNRNGSLDAAEMLALAEDEIEQIHKDTDRDRFMSSEEAVEYGLIDKVLLPEAR